MCEREQGSILRNVCLLSLPPDELVTQRGTRLYGCVGVKAVTVREEHVNPSAAICWTVPHPVYSGVCVCVCEKAQEGDVPECSCMYE